MSGAASVVFAALSASSGLGAYVSGRIYAEPAPQTAAFPLVVYRIISEEPVNTMQGFRDMARTMVQVDCYAAKYADADAMAGQARTAICGGGTTWKALPTDRRHLFDESERMHNVSQDFAVWV